MAKQPQQSANAQPVKFPKNWSKMTQAERRKWETENRPGFNPETRAAAPVPAPASVPAPAPVPAPADQWNEHEENAAAAEESETAEEPKYGEASNEGMREAAGKIDAGKVVARILREIADAFDGDA